MIVFRCLLLFCLALSVTAQRPASRSVETMLSEAGALVQAGRLEEAEAATRKIVGAYPRNAEAHSLLGVILDQRKQTAEAEKEYAAALRLQPKLVSALSNYGVLLARTHRVETTNAPSRCWKKPPARIRGCFSHSVYVWLKRTSMRKRCTCFNAPMSCGRRLTKCSTTLD